MGSSSEKEDAGVHESGEEENIAHENGEEDGSQSFDKNSNIKRGRSLLARINRMRDKNQKLRVNWNSKGQPIGETRANLMSYIGISARSRVSINIPRWDQVQPHIKESIWVQVSGVFDIPQDRKKWLIGQAGERWKGFKSNLTTKYMCDKDDKIIPHPPKRYTFIDQEEWDRFLATRQSAQFKEESKKHSALVYKNEHPYRASRLGYAGVEEEVILEKKSNEVNSKEPHLSSSKISIPRHDLWLAVRARKDRPMDESVRKVADQMELVSQQVSRGEVVLSGRKDLLATVLGKKEHPGRVRAAGSGVGILQYFGREKEGKNDDMEILKDKVAALTRELELVKRSGIGLTHEQNNQPHEEGKTPCTNVCVDDIDLPEGWTECLLSSQELGHPIVAKGKVLYALDIKSVMIHNKPLQHGNMKVEVTEAILMEAPLPVPTSEASIVSEAVRSFVEWPKNLILLEQNTTAKNRKRKRQSSENDNLSESSNNIKGQSEKVKDAELKLIESSSPTIQMMYKIARHLEGTIAIPLAKELSHEGQLWITREEIFQWILQEQIQATHISVFMGCLLDLLVQDKNILSRFGYLCPHKVSDIPIDFKKDYQKKKNAITAERAMTKTQYIADTMLKANKSQLYFVPYNVRAHWMLCVLHPYKEMAYWFDPLGLKVREDFKITIETSMKIWAAQVGLNKFKKSITWVEVKCPRQTNNTDCGYYVLRYILDIMKKRQDSNLGEFYVDRGSKPLSKREIKEVRHYWIAFVQKFMP